MYTLLSGFGFFGGGSVLFAGIFSVTFWGWNIGFQG